MRIAFGVVSSFNTSQAIAQICSAVGDRHVVVVHHDFSKQPDFSLSCSNAHILEDPAASDWGGWGFVQAVLKIAESALEKFEFDYFQLLSDTCLPIRPIAQFEEYLQRERPDATFEALALDATDNHALLNYGYCFYPRNRLEKTTMRRLARLVLQRPDGRIARQERGGLALDLERPSSWRSRIASVLHASLVSRARSRLPLEDGCIYTGSTWFGVSRQVLARMLDVHRESTELSEHFRRNAQTVDEGYLATLIMRAGPNRRFGFNHYVKWTQRRTGPDELAVTDLESLRESGKFFARKFPKDPGSAIRAMVLSGLCATSTGSCAS